MKKREENAGDISIMRTISFRMSQQRVIGFILSGHSTYKKATTQLLEY